MARARRRRGTTGESMDVWSLANKLRECESDRNALPTLPNLDEVSVDADVKQYVGRLCLLQVADEIDADQEFAKRC